MKTYKSFFKQAGGQKNEKCNYTTRLDTYGKGCYHDCKYCYAKQLLNFRKLWHPNDISVAPIQDIKKVIETIPAQSVIRLGGMTDCFQPIEQLCRNTYKTISLMNQHNIHQLIVTKSDIVATEEYLELFDKSLTHIQISIETTDDNVLSALSNAPNFEARKQTAEILQDNGFDVSIRLSPFLYETADIDQINEIDVDKCLVEFLRNKPSIDKQMGEYATFDKYTVKAIGYRHLSLNEKLRIINQLKFNEISLCDSVHEHHNYFKEHINANPNDCCNLRLEMEQ